MFILQAIVFIGLAILLFALALVIVSQRYLFKTVIGLPPDQKVVPCVNCSEWLRPTSTGPVHISRRSLLRPARCPPCTSDPPQDLVRGCWRAVSVTMNAEPRRAKRRQSLTRAELLPDAGPFTSELHYLYALLRFSDAWPDMTSITYRPAGDIGVLDYKRDGKSFRLALSQPEEVR